MKTLGGQGRTAPEGAASGETGIPPALPPAPPRPRPWLAPLAVALVAIAFFSPFFLQGKVFLAADTLFQFSPWRSHAPPGFVPHNTLITDPVNMGHSFSAVYNEQLKEGKFLSWSPYVLGGVPTANGRSHPLTLLYHRLFPTHVAVTLILFTHLLLMGLFMHLFLREIGAGSLGAVFGATAYMLNGCAMVWLSFETVIPNAAYVPLLLLAMERFQGRRRWLWAFVGAAALGLVVLLGHVQYLLYVLMILLLYGVFLLARAAARKAPARELAAIAACGAITALGGALLGALELLPTYEVIASSSRASRTFDFAALFDQLGSVPYRWLVTLIFPDYFGSPVLRAGLMPSPPKEYLNYNELCYYMGVPTVFAFLALALRPRTPHARFFLGLTVATAMMLAGSWLFYPFFAAVPGLDKLNPTRMIFIFVFAAAAGAGLGIRNLEEAGERWRKAFVVAAALLTTGVVVLALASSSPAVIDFFNAEQTAAGGDRAAAVYGSLGRLRALSSPLIARPLAIAAFSGALFGLWAWFARRRWAPLLPALLTLLLAYDLTSFGWGYNTLVEPRMIFPSTPSIEFLQRQPGPFRVVLDRRDFFVNSLQPYGIQEVGGYLSVYPERVNRLFSAIEYGPRALQGVLFDRWVLFSNLGHPLFDLLNVRYLLLPPGFPLTEGPRFRVAYAGDATIVENRGALPRAFAVHRPVRIEETAAIINYMMSPAFDPRTQVVVEEEPPAGYRGEVAAPPGASAVSVDRYAFDEVALTARMAANGWVVLSDTYFPGWEAEVDGTPTRIRRADCALRAVPVPAGSHRVVFRYRPAALRRGRLLSLAGLLAVGAGIALAARAAGGRSERRRPGSAQGRGER